MRKQWIAAIIVIIAVASIGAIAAVSRAAGPFVSGQPEAATLAPGTSLFSDTSASGGAAVRFSAKYVPAAGIYWGMYTDTAGDIGARERQVGRTLAIHQKYSTWNAQIPGDAAIASDRDNNRITLVTWLPTDIDMNRIASGAEDSVIIAKAQALKATNRPVFLRFAHEMNGSWYSWNGSKYGNSAASYVAAWRHVRQVFDAQGATNVAWVWCPNFSDFPEEGWNHWTNYYPGDAYVDWVGIDGYNWGTSVAGKSWKSFNTVFGGGTTGVYADYAARKPIMIAETASAEAGGDKAQWIRDMVYHLKNTFPAVKAVVWFDSTGTSPEWHVDTTTTSLDAYKEMSNSDYTSAMP